MNWERLFERHGEQWGDAGTEPDPFQHLESSWHTKTGHPAHVEMNTHRSYEAESGWMKCSVSVRIACPQTEKHINMAGEAAFMKSLELMNDGMSILVPGLPPIGSIE